MKTFVVLCFYALAVTGASGLYAQSRYEKTIGGSEVTPHTPGDTGSSSTFRSYSYGLGGAPAGSAPATNIMGGTYNSTAPFTFNYGNLEANRSSAPIVPPAVPSGPGSDILYRGLLSSAPEASGGEGAVGALLRRSSSLWTPQEYGQAGHRLDSKKIDHEPVKSLVPTGGGMYHDYLELGEKAFRSGDYSLAFSRFRMANYIGQKDPESLLSMSQAQFACKNYPLAACYFRQALRYMPRLPMVPLQPKAFYGDPSVYVQNIQDLNGYLDEHPQDVDALMLRAYYAWFDVDEIDPAGKARDSLQMALAGNKTPDVTLGIESFWDGMVASGKAKGALRPPATVKAARSVK